ncbi:MAG: hypothetical protein OXI79_18785 [Gammaproteobacteria bacterium]|nr:hypothetical protein [Gammaproteobacteria bacterium]
MNRAYAIAIALLGIAFFGRVVAHIIQITMPVAFLPPLESFKGSELPDPVLLGAQIVILILFVVVVRRIAAGSRVIALRWAYPTIVLGVIYFLVMTARLALGLTILADDKWFAAPIPASFHLVLASAVILIGAYDRTHVARESAAHSP